jgi:hypothetical protein
MELHGVSTIITPRGQLCYLNHAESRVLGPSGIEYGVWPYVVYGVRRHIILSCHHFTHRPDLI